MPYIEKSRTKSVVELPDGSPSRRQNVALAHGLFAKEPIATSVGGWTKSLMKETFALRALLLSIAINECLSFMTNGYLWAELGVHMRGANL